MKKKNSRFGFLMPLVVAGTTILLLLVVIIGTAGMSAVPSPVEKIVVNDPGEIQQNPNSFAGMQTTVGGTVSQVISERAFVLEGSSPGAQMVVIEDDYAHRAGPKIAIGDPLQVSGVVHVLSERELGRLECALSATFPSGEFAPFQGQAYMLAAGVKSR